jgi:hypothetical protein
MDLLSHYDKKIWSRVRRGPDCAGGRPAVNYQASVLLPRQAVEAWEPSNRPTLCLPGNEVSHFFHDNPLFCYVYIYIYIKRLEVFTAMEIRTVLFGYDITAGSWVQTFRRKILTISSSWLFNDAVSCETTQNEMTGLMNDESESICKN